VSPKRRSGHYCWSCDRMRPNEKFSGGGHARHLCKDCARLGQDELAYRQAVRNLERLVTWEGFIPRKKRKQFRKYLEHEDARVRAYAREIEAGMLWLARNNGFNGTRTRRSAQGRTRRTSGRWTGTRRPRPSLETTRKYRSDRLHHLPGAGPGTGMAGYALSFQIGILNRRTPAPCGVPP